MPWQVIGTHWEHHSTHKFFLETTRKRRQAEETCANIAVTNVTLKKFHHDKLYRGWVLPRISGARQNIHATTPRKDIALRVVTSVTQTLN